MGIERLKRPKLVPNSFFLFILEVTLAIVRVTFTVCRFILSCRQPYPPIQIGHSDRQPHAL
jgi:hypothetical protein